jgi:hypothetical protein
VGSQPAARSAGHLGNAGGFDEGIWTRGTYLPNKFDGKFAASCVGSTDLSGNKRTDRLLI